MREGQKKNQKQIELRFREPIPWKLPDNERKELVKAVAELLLSEVNVSTEKEEVINELQDQ